MISCVWYRATIAANSAKIMNVVMNYPWSDMIFSSSFVVEMQVSKPVFKIKVVDDVHLELQINI